MLPRNTDGRIADQPQASESEPTRVALVSLDGTPGDAFQLVGVINAEGTILASVDRRRLLADDAVHVLRAMFGPDTEIVVGVMPERVVAR